jgi:nitrile hydratase accessory protein
MTPDRPGASPATELAAAEDGRIFAEPWEARAFAIAVALHDAGLFSWPEWTAALGEEIGNADSGAGGDGGQSYYRHWFGALEKMVVGSGVADTALLDLYRTAWARACERTPHGRPIELLPGDFDK